MSNIFDFSNYRVNNEVRCTSHLPSLEDIGNRKIFYILVGIPNAGKTTYANQYLVSPQTVVVSSNGIRKNVTGTYMYSSEDNTLVFDVVAKEIKQALLKGSNVVLDSTNLHKRYRKNFLGIAKEFDCYTVAILFKTPLDVCLERNKGRDFREKVPVEVIKRMSRIALSVYKHEGYDEIITIKS